MSSPTGILQASIPDIIADIGVKNRRQFFHGWLKILHGFLVLKIRAKSNHATGPDQAGSGP
jgi:hypothetical protein